MFHWNWNWHHHHRHHRHKPSRHHLRVLLVVIIEGKESIFAVLNPGRKVNLMTTLTVGHKLALAIAFLDANGNPMLTAPTVDSPPVWGNTTPATETLVASADGLSAVATSVAPGTDAISLTVLVGGVSYAASLSVEVDAAPQVLTSVAIDATVQ